MSFGLAVFRADGVLGFSSDDVTWNQIDMVYCPGGGSVSRNYPTLVGREAIGVQIMIDPPPLTRRAIAHTVTIAGPSVTVSGGSENAYILILMR